MPWPLTILHISDLHFGPHSRFAEEGTKGLAKRIRQAIEWAREELEWEEAVGLCIVTGDVTEAARPKEYEEALEFFEALVGELGLARPRVIFAPGNHDLSWNTTNERFKNFDQFLATFYGMERPRLPGVQEIGYGACVHSFPKEQLAVAVLNSCERVSHLHQGGALSREQAQALMSHWAQGEARHWIKLVAIHHNPVATADAVGLEGYENLKAVASDCQIQFVFHGHHHAVKRVSWPWEGAVGQTHVLSAGNWGHWPEMLPEVQPNTMHLIRIDPARQRVQSALRTFDPRARALGHVQPGYFTQDPAHSKRVALPLSLPQGFQEGPPAEERAAVETDFEWDFFLAHASADRSRAESLYAALSTNHKVFLDVRSVRLGDDWARTIKRALEEARLIIILISENSEEAHYQREEISTAIQLARKDTRRRVIPVFLDGVTAIPYGLGSIQGLDARNLGMEEIAAELRKAAAGQGPAVSQAHEASSPAQEENHTPQEFIDEYRLFLKGQFVLWELGAVRAFQVGTAREPIEAKLDDMYLPLRLAKVFNPGEHDAESLLEPAALLEREKPLVVRGAAGSGKTAWMRWTFRRLLEMPSAIPFMVELRRLTRVWNEKKARGSERTITAYLCDWVAESGVSGWEEAVPQVFKAQDGPRPVLLIDGWDELGELGEELRQKLSNFLAAHPRVLAVVSSRTHGASRPSRYDGFDVFDLQPLSDDEITDFTRRFYRQVHGEDETRSLESSRHFKTALGRSPEALSLARTPLLLTMMLLINRGKPLPDRRHVLYSECIHTMLSALPARREKTGAGLQQDQWRPEDSAERWRALEELAFQIQSAGYKEKKRGQIVNSPGELERMLPSDWKLEEKQGFLTWLVEEAGVMMQLADGTLSFAHLSFQEYLTASRLDAHTWSDEDRRKSYRERMSDVNWWETLRLWAAIIEDRKPALLLPILQDLVRGEPAGFWLVGAILADGQGKELFGEWCQGMARRFHVGEAIWSDMSAQAWRSSQQDGLRLAIAARWQRLSAEWSWLSAVFAWNWSEAALIDAAHGDAFEEVYLLAGESQGVGRARVLFGFNPVWPSSPEELVFLRLFPSKRGMSAAQYQAAISLGASRDDLERVVLHGRAQQGDQKARDFAQDFAKESAQGLTRGVALDLARDLARDFARGWARGWARDFAQDFAQDFARYFALGFAQDFANGRERGPALDFSRGLAQYFTRYLARYFSLDFALDFSLDFELDFAWDVARDLGYQETPVWLIDWVAVELSSPGRAWTRTALAHLPRFEKPLHRLLQAACQVSLNPDADRASLEQALSAYPKSEDPLWPALARHLARCSTDEDRALLTDLAQHPEKRGEPLASGLKYYVRGDLVFEDGSEITLDALCDSLGLPHLPYLEEMPPELDVEDS